jgi:hypothetical protein
MVVVRTRHRLGGPVLDISKQLLNRGILTPEIEQAALRLNLLNSRLAFGMNGVVSRDGVQVVLRRRGWQSREKEVARDKGGISIAFGVH